MANLDWTVSNAFWRMVTAVLYKPKFQHVGLGLNILGGIRALPSISNKGKLCAGNNLTILSWLYPVAISVDYGASVTIGNSVVLNQGAGIWAHSTITIGDSTIIGTQAQITDADTPADNSEEENKQQIKIGKHVWIGARTIIHKGVTVGDNAVVAAGSIVTRDVAPNTMVAGQPAEKIRDLTAR